MAVSPINAGAAADHLSGAGSTLVAPLVARCAQTFKVFFGASVSYNAAGSQAAIAGVSARAVDFGATDSPLTSAQATECRDCYQIPWALTAIGIGYHVRGIGGTLHLSGRVLAEIYLGQISRWNDHRIKARTATCTYPRRGSRLFIRLARETHLRSRTTSRMSAAAGARRSAAELASISQRESPRAVRSASLHFCTRPTAQSVTSVRHIYLRTVCPRRLSRTPRVTTSIRT